MLSFLMMILARVIESAFWDTTIRMNRFSALQVFQLHAPVSELEVIATSSYWNGMNAVFLVCNYLVINNESEICV